jgi:hypothetical protein
MFEAIGVPGALGQDWSSEDRFAHACSFKRRQSALFFRSERDFALLDPRAQRQKRAVVEKYAERPFGNLVTTSLTSLRKRELSYKFLDEKQDSANPW